MRVRLVWDGRTGAQEWRDAVNEMDADCPAYRSAGHGVDVPETHSEMLDGDYGPDDVDEATADEMRDECESFARSNVRDLSGLDAAQVGRDFWLTRNRHGAGFWDSGLGDAGQRLTDAAHAYGSCDLYVGDDGKVYGS
jgi:hypothetical protein